MYLRLTFVHEVSTDKRSHFVVEEENELSRHTYIGEWSSFSLSPWNSLNPNHGLSALIVKVLAHSKGFQGFSREPTEEKLAGVWLGVDMFVTVWVRFESCNTKRHAVQKKCLCARTKECISKTYRCHGLDPDTAALILVNLIKPGQIKRLQVPPALSEQTIPSKHYLTWGITN